MYTHTHTHTNNIHTYIHIYKSIHTRTHTHIQYNTFSVLCRNIMFRRNGNLIVRKFFVSPLIINHIEQNPGISMHHRWKLCILLQQPDVQRNIYLQHNMRSLQTSEPIRFTQHVCNIYFLPTYCPPSCANCPLLQNSSRWNMKMLFYICLRNVLKDLGVLTLAGMLPVVGQRGVCQGWLLT